MPYGEITSAEATEIWNSTGCEVEICTRTSPRELRIYGSPEMLSICYRETFMLLKQGHQKGTKRAPKGHQKGWESCAVDAPLPMTTADPSADDAPTPTNYDDHEHVPTFRYGEPQANAPMPPPKTPMPKKEKQHETDEGGNTQPPSEPQVIELFGAIHKEKGADDERYWSGIKGALASPKASTRAQETGQSNAKESPLFITPKPGGQTMAMQTPFERTSTADVFDPVPTFPFQPGILKPPPGLEGVIAKTEEYAFRWQ